MKYLKSVSDEWFYAIIWSSLFSVVWIVAQIDSVRLFCSKQVLYIFGKLIGRGTK